MRRQSSVAVLLTCVLGLAATAAAQDALIDLGSKGARQSRAERGAPPGCRRAPREPMPCAHFFARVTTTRRWPSWCRPGTTISAASVTRPSVSVSRGSTSTGPTSRQASPPRATCLRRREPRVHGARPAPVASWSGRRSSAVLARYYPGAAADLREVDDSRQRHRVRAARTRSPRRRRSRASRCPLAARCSTADISWRRGTAPTCSATLSCRAVARSSTRSCAPTATRYFIFPNKPDHRGTLRADGGDVAGQSRCFARWAGSRSNTTDRQQRRRVSRSRQQQRRRRERPAGLGDAGVSSTSGIGTHRADHGTNQKVAVTNLFYLNNVVHDRLYGTASTKRPATSRRTTSERAARGNDPVNAEAQDGGGTNNANFATPADGSRPRMQMYLWNTATPESRRRPRLGHRLPRVRPRSDLADDRQHDRRHSRARSARA